MRLESLRTADQEEAKRRLILREAKRFAVKQAPAAAIPMRDVLVWYYETHAKPNTRSHKAAAFAFRLLLDFLPAGARADAFTHAEQVAFVEEHRELGRSTGYIRRILVPIRAALKRAIKHGKLVETGTPIVDLSLAPEGAARERVLSIDEAKALLAAVDGQLRLFIIVSLMTAARPEAVLELTRRQIDFDHGIIRLNPPGREQVKTKFRPDVPLAKPLVPYLVNSGPHWVFPGQAGENRKTVAKAFRQAREDAGLDDQVTAYTLRHTVATQLARRGVPQEQISRLLGHRVGHRTTERYTKVSPDHLAEVVGALEAFAVDLGLCLPAPSQVDTTSRA